MTMPLATPRTTNPVRSIVYLALAAAAVVLAVLAVQSYGQPEASRTTELTGIDRIQRDADALIPTLTSDLAKRYAAAAKNLPRQKTRTVYRHTTNRKWMTRAAYDALPEDQRKEVSERPFDEQFYYNTGYGSPLSYARAIDILAEAGLKDVKDLRMLDFGCGGIAPMRLLASLGADAVGVDVETLFPVLYSEAGDQGEVTTGNGKGKITLITGQWPAEEATRAAIGGGYDVIISKNTLKNGYIHPARPVDKKYLVELGVDDAAYVKALFDALKPGGRVLIYNICPHLSTPEEDFKPWSDGRCPFPADMIVKAGFTIAAFDVDDSPACRAMARTLGWDKGTSPIDLETDLFAQYTLFEKPR